MAQRMILALMKPQLVRKILMWRCLRSTSWNRIWTLSGASNLCQALTQWQQSQRIAWSSFGAFLTWIANTKSRPPLKTLTWSHIWRLEATQDLFCALQVYLMLTDSLQTKTCSLRPVSKVAFESGIFPKPPTWPSMVARKRVKITASPFGQTQTKSRRLFGTWSTTSSRTCSSHLMLTTRFYFGTVLRFKATSVRPSVMETSSIDSSTLQVVKKKTVQQAWPGWRRSKTSSWSVMTQVC